MRKSGTPTRYPGVTRIAEGVFRVRGSVTDPRTGRRLEVDRVLHNTSAKNAALKKAALLAEERDKHAERSVVRMRVGDYARSWLRRKLAREEIGPETGDVYAAALEDHILPALGDYFYDSLTEADIQRWIDESLEKTWHTRKRRGQASKKAKCRRRRRGKCKDACTCARIGEVRKYGRPTVQNWFRAFRTMTRDAVGELRLPYDPTLRIRFPQLEGGKASMKEQQLVDFLVAMRTNYPQHYGLVVLLAYTGLRFCHASALRWDDWDREVGVIKVVRKHYRGRVGPVSLKKRANREYPVEPAVAEVLQWHHERLVKEQSPGVETGYMFPSSTGTLRTPSSLDKAWNACLTKAGIAERVTPHGMRYTFSNLLRRAKVDQIARRALMGHVTEEMQHHYENDVELKEKRSAVAAVIRLAPLGFEANVGTDVGTHVGTSPENDSGRSGNAS